MEYRHIDPTGVSPKDFYQYLIGAISPRPIALVSTLSKEGIPNAAPFSFFNAFSGKPPIVGFSVNRRGDGVTGEKDTYNNIMVSGELVINTVPYNLAHQMALSSAEFASDINEFERSGFTAMASERVSPWRIGESPIQMECRLEREIPLTEDGAGTYLLLCRILLMHIRADVLNERGRVDPHRADLTGRMGRQYYIRSSGEAIFEIPSFSAQSGGYGQIPVCVRESSFFTGKQLTLLAGLPALPDLPQALEWAEQEKLDATLLQHPSRMIARISAALDGAHVTEAAILTVLLDHLHYQRPS